MGCRIALISTLETKAIETQYLQARLATYGLEVQLVDVSLRAGSCLADSKLDVMTQAVDRAILDVIDLYRDGIAAIVGIGGGTGGELIMRAMRALPATFPKVVASPLPADPRRVVADTSIILVPTLSDVAGINELSRDIFENVAATVSGLCNRAYVAPRQNKNKSIAITALGSTESALLNIKPLIEASGDELTVFHANGYGGAAFSRLVEAGAFDAVVDMTPHELTRIMLGGGHVPMPGRFSAAIQAGLHPVVLPGAINFVGFGMPDEVPDPFRNRPHYRHSGQFTHVQVNEDEMAQLAAALVNRLNIDLSATLIIPMGGFSHQDCPGGAIESATLRSIFRDTARKHAGPKLSIIETDHHIGDPETARLIKSALDKALSRQEAHTYA